MSALEGEMDAVGACRGVGSRERQGFPGWVRTWPSWGQQEGGSWDFGVRTRLLGQSQRVLDLCSLWGGFTRGGVYIHTRVYIYLQIHYLIT